MSTPTSTIDSFLMKKGTTGNTYSILVPIKDYPDHGGTPEGLDTTTLSDHFRTSVPGLEDLETMEFTCNYDATDYETIKGLAGTEQTLATVFGKTAGQTTTYGGSGIFGYKGYVDVHINGAGVNEVREMTVTVNRTSEIEKLDSITVG